jgi:hypothetical protein
VTICSPSLNNRVCASIIFFMSLILQNALSGSQYERMHREQTHPREWVNIENIRCILSSFYFFHHLEDKSSGCPILGPRELQISLSRNHFSKLPMSTDFNSLFKHGLQWALFWRKASRAHPVWFDPYGMLEYNFQSIHRLLHGWSESWFGRPGINTCHDIFRDVLPVRITCWCSL